MQSGVSTVTAQGSGFRIAIAFSAFWESHVPCSRNPSGTLLPFLGSRFPYIIYQQKKGTLIIIWLLGYQVFSLYQRVCWFEVGLGSRTPNEL